METGTNIQKLVQVSKMYYMEGLTQEIIAKSLGISRSAVSMLLTEAKHTGIVQIQIKDPSVNNEELAAELEQRFHLKKCIVVPSSIHNEDILLKIVASQASRFASDIMSSHSSIGVAWGSTCYEFMHSFSDDTQLCDISVVPLIGGSPLLSREFQLNESVRDFAEKLRGIPVFIYSPGIVDTLEDKKRCLESMYMQAIIEKWKTLDFAILGIGRPPESYERNQSKYVTSNMLDEINKFPDKAIGDLCARRFNIKGEILDCSYNSKLIGIDEAGLRNVSQVLAVAVGTNKIFSIIGALNTQLLHYFVTDEDTAKQVINVLDNKSIHALNP